MSREVRAHRIILHIVHVEMHCAMAWGAWGGLVKDSFVPDILVLCFRYANHQSFCINNFWWKLISFFFLSKLVHFMQCLGMLAGKIVLRSCANHSKIFSWATFIRLKYRRNAMIRQAEWLRVVVRMFFLWKMLFNFNGQHPMGYLRQ